VLEIRSRTLPDDHPELQRARTNLAATLHALGDLPGARSLDEKVLAIRSRTLPVDHPDLQRARLNFASAAKDLGDLPQARALEEKALEILSRSLPDDHPDLQIARGNLASTLWLLGDLRGARALEETVLEVASRSPHGDRPELQWARVNLAGTLLGLGELERARDLGEKALEVDARTLPEDDPELQHARRTFAGILAAEASVARRGPGSNREDAAAADQEKRIRGIVNSYAQALRSAARLAIVDASSREAEARVSTLQVEGLATVFSFAEGIGVFGSDSEAQRDAFICSETLRAVALASARLARAAGADPDYEVLRGRRREASAELARLGQTGDSVDAFERAREKVEEADRDLVRLGTSVAPGVLAALSPTLHSLEARLTRTDALVSFRRYARWRIEPNDPPAWLQTESLCAFVVRSGSDGQPHLARVELGPIELVDRATQEWRDAIGIDRERGASDLADTGANTRRCVGWSSIRSRRLSPERRAWSSRSTTRSTPCRSTPCRSAGRRGSSAIGSPSRFADRCSSCYSTTSRRPRMARSSRSAIAPSIAGPCRPGRIPRRSRTSSRPRWHADPRRPACCAGEPGSVASARCRPLAKRCARSRSTSTKRSRAMRPSPCSSAAPPRARR
jgi:tetratricopeptide (TPR) repeat protein